MKRVGVRLVAKDLESCAKTMSSRGHKRDLAYIKRIITGDETWVCEYDVETIQQFESKPKNQNSLNVLEAIPAKARVYNKFVEN